MTSSEFPPQEQELFAAVISVVAVVVLTWMVFWMKRAARSKASCMTRLKLQWGQTIAGV